MGTISDFIISIQEVEFSIVYSPRDSDIKFSVRNELDYLDAGKLVHDVLRKLVTEEDIKLWLEVFYQLKIFIS